MFDNVRDVAFERVESAYSNTTKPVVRMIAFNTNPETGARSVEDIFEQGSADGDYNYIAKLAADYELNSNTPVTYSVHNGTSLSEFDLGKARKLQSKIIKMLEQM